VESLAGKQPTCPSPFDKLRVRDQEEVARMKRAMTFFVRHATSDAPRI